MKSSIQRPQALVGAPVVVAAAVAAVVAAAVAAETKAQKTRKNAQAGSNILFFFSSASDVFRQSPSFSLFFSSDAEKVRDDFVLKRCDA